MDRLEVQCLFPSINAHPSPNNPGSRSMVFNGYLRDGFPTVYFFVASESYRLSGGRVTCATEPLRHSRGIDDVGGALPHKVVWQHDRSYTHIHTYIPHVDARAAAVPPHPFRYG